METTRIDGIKTNLDRLTTEEVQNWLGYSLLRLHEAHESVETLQGELFKRAHDELPFEYIGEAALTGYDIYGNYQQ